MSGPSLLVLDTDVLLQLFMANAHQVLTTLSHDHGIQPIVVPEVELEVTSSSKFGARFEAPFRKSCSSGLIQVLDSRNYAAVVSGDSDLQQKAAGVSHMDIQLLGQNYNRRIDRGEAYTHATAVLLDQPAASNDFSAIKVMQTAGAQLPSPVLRTFDLVVFAYQTGVLSERECDRVRKDLLAQNEHVPKPWKNAPFTKGLQSFVPRLNHSGSAPVGAPLRSNNQGVLAQLTV